MTSIPRMPRAVHAAVLTLVAVLLAAVGCVAVPVAATHAVKPRSADDLARRSPAERQAHSLARACEGDDVAACERLGSAYWSGFGVRQHRFHALSLWEYACDQGIGTACEQAGDVYLRGELFAAKPERAAELFAEGCAAARPSSCTRAGELAMTRVDTTPSPRKAAKWWKRGCTGGDPQGCHLLGLAMLEGQGVGRDPTAGVAMIGTACDQRFARACHQLAGFQAEGLFVARDEAASAANLRRACDYGGGVSCTELGVRARAAGKADEAKTALTAACEHGDPRGCALLGDLYALGAHGLADDDGRAAAAYAEACRGGLFEACGRAAAAEGTGGIDPAELRGLYRVACDAGTVEACDYLAGMMLDGIGGPPDPQAAARLFDRACIGAYADSCVHLAWMGRGDRGRDPLRWLERACDLDDACVVLGEVHELGMVEGAKLGAAAEAYQRGCAADRPDACFRLGGVLSRGAGVARDDAAAARLYQVACEGGHAQACTALARAYEVGAGVHADAAATAHYRKRACTLDPAEGCR